MLHLLLAVLLPLASADLHVGGQIGIQSTDLVGYDANDRVVDHADIGTTDPRSGVGMGGFAEIESERIGFRASLLYSQKGWSRRYPPLIEGDRWQQSLDYLELPLELKVLSGNTRSSLRAYLLGGGYWAGLLSAHRGLDGRSNRSDWYSSAAGLSAGLGVQGKVAPARLAVQLRVRQDLTTIHGPDARRDLEVYNQSIGIDFLVGL